MLKNNPPIVILVRPQMGENIGAVARAMSNFGLTELRLVAPRDGWPNRKALEMSAGGESIIQAAKIYLDFAAAVADIQLAYATTARSRDMEKRVVAPAEAMEEIVSLGEKDRKIAIVFGPERTGLENEEVAWCDALITIPTAANYSLNLGQSAVILGYEWLRQASGFRIQDSGKGHSLIPESRIPNPESLATKEELQGLFGQLETYLDAADYFRVLHKKPIMWQNLRTILLRSQMNSQEVRTFRGMLRALWERRRK